MTSEELADRLKHELQTVTEYLSLPVGATEQFIDRHKNDQQKIFNDVFAIVHCKHVSEFELSNDARMLPLVFAIIMLEALGAGTEGVGPEEAFRNVFSAYMPIEGKKYLLQALQFSKTFTLFEAKQHTVYHLMRTAAAGKLRQETNGVEPMDQYCGTRCYCNDWLRQTTPSKGIVDKLTRYIYEYRSAVAHQGHYSRVSYDDTVDRPPEVPKESYESTMLTSYMLIKDGRYVYRMLESSLEKARVNDYFIAAAKNYILDKKSGSLV